MGMETLRKWMAEPKKDQERWGLCAALAGELFASGELSTADRAYAAYSKCKSLSNTGRMTMALEPGQIASYLAYEAGDYDLYGLSLLELAYIQSRTPGHEPHAIQSYTRFLQFQDQYSPDVRKHVPSVLFNLGVVERSCGKSQDALEHFRQAFEAAKQAKDMERADHYRRDYCWQAMTLGNLHLADDLIKVGTQLYNQRQQEVRRRPTAAATNEEHQQMIFAESHLLIERARYHLLTDDYPTAVALGMEAIVKAESLTDTSPLTEGLLIICSACEKAGDLDTAMSIGIWAHVESQQSERPELVAEVRRQLAGIRMQEREVVDRVMKHLIGPE